MSPQFNLIDIIYSYEFHTDVRVGGVVYRIKVVLSNHRAKTCRPGDGN